MGKEIVKYSTEAPWKDIPQRLLEGEVDLVITPLGESRCIIEFTSNLPKKLKKALEDLERRTRMISGQGPSVIQIYTQEGISKDKVSELIEKFDKKGIELQKIQ